MSSHPPIKSDVPLSLEVNAQLEKDIKCIVMVETLLPSSITDILIQLDSLGYEKILVKGLSSHKFLLTFIKEEDFLKLDMQLLELGFLNCRKVSMEDLIVPRRAWIECVGLPILAWSLDTFSILSEEWGKVIGISDMLDEDLRFKNPVWCINTNIVEPLFRQTKIRLLNQEFLVQLKEMPCSDNFPLISKDYDSSGSSEKELVFDSSYEDSLEDSRSKSEHREEEIFFNSSPPSTPRVDSTDNAEVAKEAEENSNEDNANSKSLMIVHSDHHSGKSPLIWSPRDDSWSSKSSEPLISNISEPPDSHSTDTNLNAVDNSFGSMVHNLDNLKIFKKRGRPRKFPNRIVKAFQIPKRYKVKSLGKAFHRHSTKNNNREALSILDTGLALELELVGNQDQALVEIERGLSD